MLHVNQFATPFCDSRLLIRGSLCAVPCARRHLGGEQRLLFFWFPRQPRRLPATPSRAASSFALTRFGQRRQLVVRVDFSGRAAGERERLRLPSEEGGGGRASPFGATKRFPCSRRSVKEGSRDGRNPAGQPAGGCFLQSVPHEEQQQKQPQCVS